MLGDCLAGTIFGPIRSLETNMCNLSCSFKDLFNFLYFKNTTFEENNHINYILREELENYAAYFI